MVNSPRLLQKTSASIIFALLWGSRWEACRLSGGLFLTPSLSTKPSQLSAHHGSPLTICCFGAAASAIEEDKDWNGGNYTTQPHLDTVAEIHNLALTTPSYRVRETAAAKFPQFLDGIDKDGLGRMDPTIGCVSSKR